MKTIITFASKIENQLADNILLRNDTLITGYGKLNSAISLMKKLQDNQYDRIINIGICGAVKKDIPVFSIFEVSKVIEGDAYSPKKNNFINLNSVYPGKFKSAVLVTGDQPVLTEEHRNQVISLGGEVVDMECFALAKVAKSFNIPFFAFKIVSDHANEKTLEFVRNNVIKASKTLCEELQFLFI
ncbi:MAG: hypothetical protein ACD_79C00249G0002 [uncultured bacterium]|nr:MAG: hypothetical protein ACD_79C00249G0002 [uncultured bacterium]